MINKKKVQRMTQDSIYLLHGYHKDSFADRYFKNDYLGIERMKNMVIFTIVYVFYVIYEIGRDFYVAVAPDFLHFDYEGYIIEKIVWYLVLALIIALLTTLCASLRYDAAFKNIDRHNDVVKEVSKENKKTKFSWVQYFKDLFKKKDTEGASDK